MLDGEVRPRDEVEVAAAAWTNLGLWREPDACDEEADHSCRASGTWVSGVRVRKRSGAGRGRGAGRRRGTCGARMPNGLAVSEASAWMAVTEASEGEDNVGYGGRHPGNLLGGRITYNVIRGYKYTQRSEDTLTQHTLVTRCRSACSPPLLRLRDSRKTVHSVLSCFVARRPDPTRSEVSTEHKKAPFPPGGPSFSFTNKVQASIVHPHIHSMERIHTFHHRRRPHTQVRGRGRPRAHSSSSAWLGRSRQYPSP